MPAIGKWGSFKVISYLGAALYTYLGVSLMFFPDAFLADLGVSCTEPIYFVARRVAVLMFSFALLLVLARNAERSWLRLGVASTIALNMAGFACTGIHAFAAGVVGKSIFVSVIIESVFVLLFACQSFADYRNLHGAGK
jgi:hypothetical protein